MVLILSLVLFNFLNILIPFQVDLQPKHEYNFAAYIYFVVFIILGSFFILNLIVGVIIDKFSRMKQLYEDTGSTGIFLSNQQMDWLNTLKRAASKKPSRTAERPKVQSNPSCMTDTSLTG